MATLATSPARSFCVNSVYDSDCTPVAGTSVLSSTIKMTLKSTYGASPTRDGAPVVGFLVWGSRLICSVRSADIAW
jgi:hypothetical protein